MTVSSPSSEGAPGSGVWIEGSDLKPLRLSDDRQAWIVRRGHVDVFGVETGAEIGRRHHLFRAEAGDVLFGTSSSDGFALTAVGTLDAAAEDVSSTISFDGGSVERWITGLCQAGTQPLTGWPDHVAVPGQMTLTARQRLAADPRCIYWIEVTAGAVHLLGLDTLHVGDRIPLAAQAWVLAETDAELSVGVADRISPSQLSLFNRAALRAIRDRIQRRADDEARVAATGQAKTRREFKSVMLDLAGAAAARFTSRSSEPVGDALGVALDALFRALHMNDREIATARAVVVASADHKTVEQRLDFILHRLRVGRRHVTLKPDFWQVERPPLLAWQGENRVPVALVFTGRGGWNIVDGEGLRPLNATSGAELAQTAVQLYPNLPAGRLQFRALFSFGGAGTSSDLVRLGVGSLMAAVLGMTIPMWSHYLIDTIIPDGRINLLGVAIAALVMTTLSIATFEIFKGMSMLRAQTRVETRLQPALIERLIRLPTGFYRNYTIGDITDRALGIQAARQTLVGSASAAVLGGVFGMMSLVPLFFYDSSLALIALGLTLLICFAIAGVSYGQLRHEREELRHQGHLEGFVMQMLVGIAKLRAAAAESRAMAQWARYFIAQRDRFVSAQWWGAGLEALMAVMPILATVVLYAAIAQYLNADLDKMLRLQPGADSAQLFSAADFVAFSTAFGQVLGSLIGMTHALTRMLVVVPLVERARPILEASTEVAEDAEDPGVLSGGVEFKRVKFRYIADGPLVIDDISLRIEPGEFVALVGPSGSGKSTLARLILGFERPEVGDIFFGAKSAERIDMSAARQQIGVVLQNGRLSSGSIFENIGGDVGIPLSEVWAAARLVGLDKDIESMPMGMHTVLLDGGATLSGGQRQRILIARALIRQPRILLLDEATSALDNRTQAIVTETLGKLSTTRIVIAHRLSTIQAVDRIFVLERGRLVETGTYDELMEKNGPFAALAKRQLL